MYVYEEQKPKILTDAGQAALFDIWQRVRDLLEESEVATMNALMRFCPGVDDWTRLAYIDRLVELGYLFEIKQAAEYVAGQHRILGLGSKVAR